MAYVLLFRGQISLRQGDYAGGQTVLAESATLFEELGDSNHGSTIARRLGQAMLHEGDYHVARAKFKESLVVNQEIGDKQAVAACLAAFAALAQAEDELRRAAQLFGASEAVSESIHTELLPYDRDQYTYNVAVLRAQLDEATFAKAWAEGRAMTLEQAIALAEQMTATEQPAQTQTQTDFPAGLTEREVEVLRWLTKGLTDAEIAEQLVVSVRTVNAHLRSIYGKLDVTTRSAATRAALELKLV